MCALGGGWKTAGSDVVDVMLARSEDEVTRARVEEDEDDEAAMGDARLLVLRVVSFSGAAECTFRTLPDFDIDFVAAFAFSALAYGISAEAEAEGASELATDRV